MIMRKLKPDNSDITRYHLHPARSPPQILEDPLGLGRYTVFRRGPTRDGRPLDPVSGPRAAQGPCEVLRRAVRLQRPHRSSQDLTGSLRSKRTTHRVTWTPWAPIHRVVTPEHGVPPEALDDEFCKVAVSLVRAAGG